MDAKPPHYNPPDRFPTGSISGLRADSDQEPLPSTAVFTPQSAHRALSRLPTKTRGNPPRPVTIFVRLPANPSHVDEALVHRPWRIKLTSPHSLPEPPGLELCGDVFAGRVAGGIQPDLDLTVYAGAELGVSRLHALLRPTPSHLLVYDLGSTNGTYLNARRVTAGAAAQVSDGAVLAFGRLQFTVRIIAQP